MPGCAVPGQPEPSSAHPDPPAPRKPQFSCARPRVRENQVLEHWYPLGGEKRISRAARVLGEAAGAMPTALERGGLSSPVGTEQGAEVARK